MQRRGLVVDHQRDAGSRSASNPAPIASRVVKSSAASRAASTPNSLTTSRGALRPASLMTFRFSVGRLERRSPDARSTRRGDMPVEHLAMEPVRDRVDELLTPRMRRCLVVEHPLHARQAEGARVTTTGATTPGAEAGPLPRGRVGHSPCWTTSTRCRPSSAYCSSIIEVSVLAAGAVSAASAARPGVAQASRIQPAQCLVNAATSPVLGSLVRNAVTSSPSTSSTNPWSAFFGPTSTNTRAPAACSVRSPSTSRTVKPPGGPADRAWRRRRRRPGRSHR